MAGVPRAKAWFTKGTVFCSLDARNELPAISRKFGTEYATNLRNVSRQRPFTEISGIRQSYELPEVMGFRILAALDVPVFLIELMCRQYAAHLVTSQVAQCEARASIQKRLPMWWDMECTAASIMNSNQSTWTPVSLVGAKLW